MDCQEGMCGFPTTPVNVFQEIDVPHKGIVLTMVDGFSVPPDIVPFQTDIEGSVPVIEEAQVIRISWDISYPFLCLHIFDIDKGIAG